MAGESVDVSRDYLDSVVLQPKYGYGSAMNPCLDCRIYMLRHGDEIARERGIDLLVTGEVLGQRAIDQSRRALRTAEREARVERRVFRPLSAALLPTTAHDTQDDATSTIRLRVHGSSRRAQLELARQLAVTDWPTPSGRCCRLADPVFARRLRDLLSHRDGDPPSREELELLTRGRHFRLAWNLKLIVARDADECVWLAEFAARGWSCRSVDGHGAEGLLEGDPRVEQLPKVARFVARYTGGDRCETVEIELSRGKRSHRIRAVSATDDQLARARI
jgi:hypothetical protein